MKKALIVASTAGFIKGFLLNDIVLLKEKGYEVHCAANGKSVTTFSVNKFFEDREILFHQIDFSSTSPISRQSFIAAKQLKKIIKDNNYELVHCHTPIVGAITRILMKSRRKKGCKVIYTTHGLAFHKGSGLKSKFIYGTTEFICSKYSDAIITINKEDYCTMKKMLCKKVYYINGVGVDTSKYADVQIDRSEKRKKIGVKDDEIMVLEVGELSDRKNHQVIVKALSRLDKNCYAFVICGKVMTNSGTYESIKALAEKYNVKVIFLGFRSDIPEICKCADIAVLPSKREGLGLAGIEALASGVPVVGTNVQGIKDYVIDGNTGYLCVNNNEESFADAIYKLSDKNIRLDMRENCIKKAKEFDISISHSQMKKIYDEIIGE